MVLLQIIDGKNKQSIHCSTCDEIVLRARTVALVDKTLHLHGMVKKQDTVSETVETIEKHWLVPDRFLFENVGVTKPIEGTGNMPFRYLCCASCDKGPIGIVFTDDFNSFYIAHDRVTYK